MLTATQERFSLNWVVSHLLLRRRLGEVLEKIKARRARTLPGLTAVGKHERARKGRGAQLSSADAL